MKHINIFLKPILAVTFFCFLGALLLIYLPWQKDISGLDEQNHSKIAGQNLHQDKPDEYLKYFESLTTKPGESKSGYVLNYRSEQLVKAKAHRVAKGLSHRTEEDLDWVERGPGNVSGRTRAVLVDPDDASNNTWIVGSASGGIWRTTDGGQTWTNLSSDLVNLATNSLAMATSNHDVIYAGTGELFAGNLSFVRGSGVFKSGDRGTSWTQLGSTVGDVKYSSVNRIVVDPADEDIVVIATNFGIYKSIDGGTSWVESYVGFVQDLVADPSDFNTLYAGDNGIGVVKSTDAGDSWTLSSSGIVDGVRFELAVSPSNPNKVYACTYDSGGANSTYVYSSSDKGATWARFEEQNGGNGDFLAEQGWYDNSIAVHPYNEDIVYLGGVFLGQYDFSDVINGGDNEPLELIQDNTDFLGLVNFGSGTHFGNTVAVDPNAALTSIEVRFGSGKSQKAHRYQVPPTSGTNGDGGAGVADNEYLYQDYVDVPFEVWDVDNDVQLMIAFRDQQADGVFQLIEQNTAGDGSTHSREYLYISTLAYDADNPNANMAVDGGHVFSNQYFVWPFLNPGETWDGDNLPESTMSIVIGSIKLHQGDATILSSARTTPFGLINSNLHPDHHNITMIPIDEATDDFIILNGNDGGMGISMDKGSNWTQITNGYNTTQFYGADKRPGANEYFGGMQDNGSWQSPPNAEATAASEYIAQIGGDGFEVLWHATDPDKLIGGSQFNGFARSINGGQSFVSAAAGINGNNAPFISRLANSPDDPDVIFALDAGGVLKNTDFGGGTWTLKSIAAEWINGAISSQYDVEVSLANPNIVWAGGGMDATRKIFVSTDQGETFTAVNNFTDVTLGGISGIYTHPTDENTAYVLFSFSDTPKILRTTDLGQTWEDISGFGTGDESTTGFPDVITHSLLVMPHDTDIIWAGTEIGLFESVDNGATWAYADNGFPPVSIWQMKMVDGQVVVATHGRGIWSVDIAEAQFALTDLQTLEYTGQRQLTFDYQIPTTFDSMEVVLNDEVVDVVQNPVQGDYTGTVGIVDEGEYSLRLIPYANNGTAYPTSSLSTTADFAPIVGTLTNVVKAIGGELMIETEVIENYDLLEFYLNDVLVESLTNPILGATEVITEVVQDGVQSVKLIGYIDTEPFESEAKELNVGTILGIDLFNREITEELTIYPNPNYGGYINFELIEDLGKELVLDVYDLGGSKVGFQSFKNQGLNSIKVNFDLKQGTYIILIKTEQQLYTAKLIRK